MHRLLQEICLDKRPVTLTADRPARVFYGRMIHYSDIPGGLDVELIECPDELSLRPGDPCTVVFSDGLRSHLFVSTFVQVGPRSEHTWKVRIEIPDCVLPTEARSAWRIPLGPDTPLRVRVRCDGRTFEPHPIDISCGGLLAEFDADSDAGIWMGEHVEVEVYLQLNGLTAALDALPQRRGDTIFAFYFADVLREMRRGRSRAPRELAPILDRLESEWLHRR